MLLTLKEKGPYKGSWDLPGGGIEKGEKATQTLIRELQEEVAIKPLEYEEVCRLEFEGKTQIDHKEVIFLHKGVLFLVILWEEIQTVKEDISEWITLENLSFTNLTPFAKESYEIYKRLKLSSKN